MTQIETGRIATPDGAADSEQVARLRVVVARLGRQLRATQAGAGLTPTQISVLFTIARLGPLGLSEVAELEGLNPTMLSRVIAQLSEDGLVSRTAAPTDRRAALVDATPVGRRLREKIHRERNRVLGAELDALSTAHRESLIDALPALEALADQLRGRSG
ncbi:MAG TPA: MarR family transcriptional regulator [Solirubrobacteraceae bacterium]|nr:MarR family transcriptional regulator [Solirubrobacteraceae bacterium]